MTLWVLGDQLNLAAVRSLAPERVLLLEARELGHKVRKHRQRLVLVFSALRHFAEELRAVGLEVVYLHTQTLQEGLDEFFRRYPGETLTQMEPADYGFKTWVSELVRGCGGQIQHLPNPLWLIQPEEFDRWAGSKKTYRLEYFYRLMRQKTGYLMQQNQPLGGAWNFDTDNRQTPPPGYQPPPAPKFVPDAITRAVIEEIQQGYPQAFGETQGFNWPVSRKEALEALEDFVLQRLPQFGPYQDALLEESWSLNHALLSPAINLGLLHPAEVVERALQEYAAGRVPLASMEGFLRQIIGWREYMFQVYRREMPALAQANQLGAAAPLPPLFWGHPTTMRCLSVVLERVGARGYAHHIERLMVLANLALLYGANPQETKAWFMAAFVDATDWVMAPNVLGMGLFATALLSSKPYAASGKYIQRMGNHCQHCKFSPSQTVGERACPFNSLYWDFMLRHRDRLGANPRLGVLYKNWDKRSVETQTEILARARALRGQIAKGEV